MFNSLLFYLFRLKVLFQPGRASLLESNPSAFAAEQNDEECIALVDVRNQGVPNCDRRTVRFDDPGRIQATPPSARELLYCSKQVLVVLAGLIEVVADKVRFHLIRSWNVLD